MDLDLSGRDNYSGVRRGGDHSLETKRIYIILIIGMEYINYPIVEASENRSQSNVVGACVRVLIVL